MVDALFLILLSIPVLEIYLAMTGEPRGFSRVAAGFSSYAEQES